MNDPNDISPMKYKQEILELRSLKAQINFCISCNSLI